jgi:spermidine synthase
MGSCEDLQLGKRGPAGLPLGVAAVLALAGFTALIAQIVLMRELIVVFYGNEITLGVMLANWLLWTAIGSSILGKLIARFKDSRRCMAGLQFLLAIIFPLTIFAVRASKAYLQATPGELLGPGAMFVGSLVTLSLFCMASGSMFAAGSRLAAASAGGSMAAATGSVYLLEACGSGLGGIAASVLLIPRCTAFEISAIVAILNLMAATSLLVRAEQWRRIALVGVVGGVGLALALATLPRVERSTLQRLWKGFQVVEVRNSRYGNLAVVETEGTRSLYANGLVVATAPNAEAAEESVHFALLQHPAPRRILLIGGGINGSLKQALQHPSLESVDYVELDPVIIDLAERHFAGEWSAARADPRVQIHRLDGRLFLKTAESTFDVIIVNLPDPQTAQLNRFYTREFFEEAARKLSPNGVLSFQLTAAEDYISPQLGEFLRCINRTLLDVFPEVAAMPGPSVHFFASTQRGVLTLNPDVLVARLKSRHLQTQYVREYFLPFRLSPDRVEDLHQQLVPKPSTPLNLDFAPIAYYFDVALWSSQFRPGQTRWLAALSQVRFPLLLGGLATFCALTIVVSRVVSKGHSQLRERQAVVGSCVAAMGFALMGLEILILLGFQAIYGYVYHQLAILVAAVMAGMALGAWLAMRRHSESVQSLRSVAWLQLPAALAPISLFAILQGFTRVTSDTGQMLVSQIAFPLIALACGLMGGYQFSLASRTYFADSAPSSAGVLYGLDLMGAALGAVLLSLYWFPVYGFLRSALLMAVVSLAPAVLVVFLTDDGRCSAGVPTGAFRR